MDVAASTTASAAEVRMPRLSDSMEEGVILKWLKQVGDKVEVGDELVEIETDKANMVFEADAAGVLQEIVANEGEALPIGAVIARIGDGSTEQAPASGTPGSRGNEVLAKGTESAPAPRREAGAGKGARVNASPIARRMAAERGIDLAAVSGSGPGGRIVKRDVANLARDHEGNVSGGASAQKPDPVASESPRVPPVRVSSPAPAGPTRGHGPTDGMGSAEGAKGSVQVLEPTKLQQTVSRRMAESKATAPHFYLQAEIDMGAAWLSRAALKASLTEGEVVPSFNDMVVKACAIALREFPRANGAYRDGKWELYSRVNVGVAVAASEALVVPTVFDADRKGLRQIATETRELAARVRDGAITPPELSAGTFTVSNLGMHGVSNFHAVINPPQAAILAVGAITEQPAVREGEITTARMMGVTLACDHRILYGADAAGFLGRVRALLEAPLGLSL